MPHGRMPHDVMAALLQTHASLSEILNSFIQLINTLHITSQYEMSDVSNLTRDMLRTWIYLTW